MYKFNTKFWSIERIIFLVAGSLTVSSLILGLIFSPKFFWITALVGTMQIIFAITGFCPMAIILSKFGVQSTCKIHQEK